MIAAVFRKPLPLSCSERESAKQTKQSTKSISTKKQKILGATMFHARVRSAERRATETAGKRQPSVCCMCFVLVHLTFAIYQSVGVLVVRSAQNILAARAHTLRTLNVCWYKQKLRNLAATESAHVRHIINYIDRCRRQAFSCIFIVHAIGVTARTENKIGILCEKVVTVCKVLRVVIIEQHMCM